MKIEVRNAEVKCYVCDVLINHNDIDYEGEVKLCHEGGGLDEEDMEFDFFSDEDGNELDEDYVDRSILFQECVNQINKQFF
tara:strand:- start:131 stop:373 length:243 start_codon:yes stop_codon:yes gene_type:complete